MFCAYWHKRVALAFVQHPVPHVQTFRLLERVILLQIFHRHRRFLRARCRRHAQRRLCVWLMAVLAHAILAARVRRAVWCHAELRLQQQRHHVRQLPRHHRQPRHRYLVVVSVWELGASSVFQTCQPAQHVSLAATVLISPCSTLRKARIAAMDSRVIFAHNRRARRAVANATSAHAPCAKQR